MKIKNKLRTSVKRLFGAMFLLGIFLGSPMVSFAGSPVEASSEEGWTLIAEKGDIKAYAKVAQCGSDEQSMYLVKLVNNSKTASLSIDYSIQVLNDPAAGASKGSIDLRPNTAISGVCGSNSTNLLQVYAPITEDVLLSNLQFIILTTKTANDEK